MLIDARSVAKHNQFDCDLCIIGAGPAGISIADRLRGSGLSVVLLESGGFDYELPTQKLYRGELSGQTYYRLDGCRWRMFGGGSNRWGGWCRPLEAVDYAGRDWLDLSGWPIDGETLVPYEAAAAALFELANARFDLPAWRDRLPEPLALEHTHFQNTVFQHSPETNFGEVYRDRVIGAANVTTMLYANATRIRLDPRAPLLREIEVTTLSGTRFSIRPRAAVLAAGGIENARLLLVSRAERPAGVGNEHDWVGRCFMEHLHMPMGHLVAPRAAAINRFYGKLILDDVRLRGVITPTPDAQQQLRLLATSIAIEDASYALGTPFVGWPPALMFAPVRGYRLLRKLGSSSLAERFKQLAQRLHSAPTRIGNLRTSRAARARASAALRSGRVYSLYFRGEQAPDRANRVTLTERRDALGVPLCRLEWRMRAFDIESLTRWLEAFGNDLKARGLGEVVGPPEDWVDGFTGGPHHMGTTRMSADPRLGVVNADCRVHSVDNLYIAGSSVFATSGYANPTFTLVTLALRLADTLRERLARA
jgi:choline dehydrogenase-like flavoprotein